MSERSIRILPGSTFGKWTVGLVAVMPILFAIGMSLADSFYEGVPAGRSIPADILGRPFLAISMVAGMAAGIAGFVLGLLAILRQKDRAILVLIATVIGGLLVAYLAAELAFPH